MPPAAAVRLEVCRVLAVLLLGAALMSCAPRQRGVPQPVPAPAPPVETQGPEARPPATPAPPDPAALPGANRVYPSQDPRNRPLPGAPEAFPPLRAGRAVDAADGDDEASGAGSPAGDAAAPGPPLTGSAESGPPDAGPAPAPAAPPDAGAERDAGGDGEGAGGIGEDGTADAARPEVVGSEQGASTDGSAPRPSAAGPASPGAPERPSDSGPVYAVQLLASASHATALERARSLARHFGDPPVVVEQGGLFKVRVGACRERAAANALRRRAVELGFDGAFVVAQDPGPAAEGR